MTAIKQQPSGNNTQTVGLFLVEYHIGSSLLGAPSFKLAMTVNTPVESVQGAGSITDTSNPPLDITTHLNGTFTYMTVMPNNSKILVTATGSTPVYMPPHSGIGPVIPSNVQLQMVLDDNWRNGTANFKYRASADDKWVSVNDAPVTATNISQISGIQAGAANLSLIGGQQNRAQGFLGKEPINPAQTTVVFLPQAGQNSGTFVIEAAGDAPNYSSAFSLERDPHFVGGLKINVNGTTGPVGAGTTPYKVAGVFEGQYTDKIVLSASNGDFLIDVVSVTDANPGALANAQACLKSA